MIEISLLPQTDRKGRGKRKAAGAHGAAQSGGSGAGGFFVAFFALVVFSGVGAFGYYGWDKVHKAKTRLTTLESEKQQVETEIAGLSDKAEGLREMRDVLNNQWEVLQALDPADRVLWSEKLNMLSNLMPSNIFLSEIKLEEKIVEVEIQSSKDARAAWEAGGKKGPSPPVARKPIITHTLTLNGVATGSDYVEQFDNVLQFHEALIEYELADARGDVRQFMENLDPTIDIRSIEAVLYEGVPVNEFVFKLQTKPSVEQAKTGTTSAAGPRERQ